MKYQRRTDEDRIAELNAKIDGIRTRAARKEARANTVHRHATLAIRAIEKALTAQSAPTSLMAHSLRRAKSFGGRSL